MSNTAAAQPTSDSSDDHDSTTSTRKNAEKEEESEQQRKPLSAEDVLKERETQIQELERRKLRQDEQIALLRSELSSEQVKHREELYWLQLEIDTLRRDKEATDDRLAELYRDLREFDGGDSSSIPGMGGDGVVDDPATAPVCIDASYVLHLQSQLSKSMQTMGILDNQITMVKKSCDEVVKSMKEEIADVMDEKCRMEMELLNQLGYLDNEKRILEEEFEEKLASKDDVIEKLVTQVEQLQQLLKAEGKGVSEGGEGVESTKTGEKTMEGSVADGGIGHDDDDDDEQDNNEDDFDEEKKDATSSSLRFGKKSSSASSINDKKSKELASQLVTVQNENDTLRQELDSSRDQYESSIRELEESNVILEEKIQALQNDLNTLRTTPQGENATEAAEVIDAIRHDREETLAALERVAVVWEKADDSIQALEEIMDNLRPYEDDIHHEQHPNVKRRSNQGESEEDRERALETLESAALVHGQVKVSLLLVELKLRNQLTSLKNDRLRWVSVGNGLLHLRKKMDKMATTGIGKRSGKGPSVPGNGEASLAMAAAVAAAEEKMNEILSEAMEALKQLEESVTERITVLEEECQNVAKEQEEEKKKNDAQKKKEEELAKLLEERNRIVQDLQNKESDNKTQLVKLQSEEVRLRSEVARLKLEVQEVTAKAEAAAAASKAAESVKKGGGQEQRGKSKKIMDSIDVNESELKTPPSSPDAAAAASRQVMERLQREVLAVVDRVKEKNETIGRLTAAIEEHKVREAALKKELKRMMKRVRAVEDDSNKEQVTGSSSGGGAGGGGPYHGRRQIRSSV